MLFHYKNGIQLEIALGQQDLAITTLNLF
jgi:hypothetical protein